MVYADLSPYEYCLPIALPDVLNVGWLDGSSSFSRGVVSPRLLEKLNMKTNAELTRYALENRLVE